MNKSPINFELALATLGEQTHFSPLTPYSDFDQWFASITHAGSSNDYYGLLSAVQNAATFSVPRFESGQRIQNSEDFTKWLRVLFTIADGWTSHSNFYRSVNDIDYHWFYVVPHPTRGAERVESRDLRYMLAGKAMKVLSQHFFAKPISEFWSSRTKYSISIDASSFLLSKEFEIARSFFAVNPDGGISNLKKPLGESGDFKAITNWLLQVPKIIWEWTPEEHSPGDSAETDTWRAIRNQQVETLLPVVRRWMIEVLYALGPNAMETLHEWIFDFDEACLTRLHEIALRSQVGHTRATQFLVPGSRRSATLDEAALVGSVAAQLLLRRQAGDKALRGLRDAREQHDEHVERAWRQRTLAEAEAEALAAQARLEALRAGASTNGA